MKGHIVLFIGSGPKVVLPSTLCGHEWPETSVSATRHHWESTQLVMLSQLHTGVIMLSCNMPRSMAARLVRSVLKMIRALR